MLNFQYGRVAAIPRRECALGRSGSDPGTNLGSPRVGRRVAYLFDEEEPLLTEAILAAFDLT